MGHECGNSLLLCFSRSCGYKKASHGKALSQRKAADPRPQGFRDEAAENEHHGVERRAVEDRGQKRGQVLRFPFAHQNAEEQHERSLQHRLDRPERDCASEAFEDQIRRRDDHRIPEGRFGKEGHAKRHRAKSEQI